MAPTEIKTNYKQKPEISEISFMLLLPTDIKTKTIMENKCKFYNRGYCKHKDQCKYVHPTSDCIGNCLDTNICPNRHRKICKFGHKCYHNKTNVCEYIHKRSEEQNEMAHKVILASPSPVEEELKKEIENLKAKIDNLEVENKTLQA